MTTMVTPRFHVPVLAEEEEEDVYFLLLLAWTSGQSVVVPETLGSPSPPHPPL
jgi:hypothetical protein